MSDPQKLVQSVFQNPYVMTIVKLTLVLYAAQIAPRLPKVLVNFFGSTIGKVVGIALILLALYGQDYQLAILVAIAYVLTMNFISGRRILESFANYTEEKIDTSRLLESKAMIYPGCNNITMDQLTAAFEGDQARLASTVVYAYRELMNKLKDKPTRERIEKIARSMGLPYNFKFTDENSPYIASLLVYYGTELSDSCSPPK